MRSKDEILKSGTRTDLLILEVLFDIRESLIPKVGIHTERSRSKIIPKIGKPKGRPKKKKAKEK